MATNSQPLVTARDIARILFRQGRKIALFISGVMALTLLVIALYPRSYSSEAKLLVRIGRETVGLDPTATTGETIMLHKTQDDELNSAITILTGRGVLERVVERVGAKRILAEAGSDGAAASSGIGAKLSASIDRVLETLGWSDQSTEAEQAIRHLDDKLVAEVPKKSTVITVRYTALSPQLAHDVTEAVTNVFREEHTRLNQTVGSLTFFSEQVEKLHDDLQAAQIKLRDRKNAYQLTTSTNRRSILEKAKEAMRQKTYDLALQESELRSRYTDEYPPLREIRRQREQAQQILTSMPGEMVGPQAANSVSITGRETTEADRQQKKLNTELRTLNDQEFELAQLDREVRLLEGKYAMHVQKLEQARLNDALGRENINNIQVAQPASLMQKPVSPRKALILGFGMVAALFGGIGLAIVAEGLDPTLRTTDQVEMELGLPVLASLPHRKHRRYDRSAQPTRGAAAVQSNGTALLHLSHVPNGSYLGLVTALKSLGANGERHAKTVGVVGCDASNVRSRVAAEIAIQAASSGPEPVLLIDGDARRRCVSKRFHLNGAPGWRDVVEGSAAAESCIKWSRPGSLAVMGPGSDNGHAQATGSAVDGLGQLGGIKSDYGLVVVDLPAARELGGPAFVAKWIDETVLVVEAERTRIKSAQRARDLLNRAGVQVTGVVLANRREHIPRWLYRRL